MSKYYTGCAVWAYRPWVGSFYPPQSTAKDFLRLYCDRMSAVEGNTTFYSMPSAATVARWADTLPADFRFCPKLPRAFSHQGALQPHLGAALAFLTTLAPLGSRLGPVMLQLPPSYGPAYAADLQGFLNSWPQQRYPLAVEVRHPDWFQAPAADRLNQQLQELGVARTLLDTRPIYEGIPSPEEDPQRHSQRRKPRLPLQPVLTASFTLVRYIGHPTPAANQPYFADWISRLCQWLQQGRTVYFFAHCPQEVRSPDIARSVYDQLRQGGANLPPLGWNQLSADTADEGQLRLF